MINANSFGICYAIEVVVAAEEMSREALLEARSNVTFELWPVAAFFSIVCYLTRGRTPLDSGYQASSSPPSSSSPSILLLVSILLLPYLSHPRPSPMPLTCLGRPFVLLVGGVLDSD